MTFQKNAIKFTRQKLAKDKSLDWICWRFMDCFAICTGQNKVKKKFQNFYIEFMETTFLKL